MAESAKKIDLASYYYWLRHGSGHEIWRRAGEGLDAVLIANVIADEAGARLIVAELNRLADLVPRENNTTGQKAGPTPTAVNVSELVDYLIRERFWKLDAGDEQRQEVEDDLACGVERQGFATTSNEYAAPAASDEFVTPLPGRGHRVRIGLTVVTPEPPEFLETPDSTRVPLSAVTDDGLRAVAKAWTKDFFRKAELQKIAERRK